MQREKQEVVITKDDLKHMNYVVCNLSVSLIKDHYKIERLIQKRIKNEISFEQYEIEYKKIINESKYIIKSFNAKFKELYIMNIINKKLNNNSIILYEKINFDNILLGIVNSLEVNIMPSNILDYIINFDTYSILDDFETKSIKISTTDDVDIKDKQYIKSIQNKINNQEKIIQKVYSKK